jgi:hypothetical protein
MLFRLPDENVFQLAEQELAGLPLLRRSGSDQLVFVTAGSAQLVLKSAAPLFGDERFKNFVEILSLGFGTVVDMNDLPVFGVVSNVLNDNFRLLKSSDFTVIVVIFALENVDLRNSLLQTPDAGVEFSLK